MKHLIEELEREESDHRDMRSPIREACRITMETNNAHITSDSFKSSVVNPQENMKKYVTNEFLLLRHQLSTSVDSITSDLIITT